MNNKLKIFLDGYIKSNAKYDRVNVFPLMCGVGKTTYLRYLISDAIREQFGLIVITDRLDNLNRIITSEIDEEFNEFIKDNSNKVTMLRSDNIKDEWNELYKKPIVLMSTQRYFNLDIDAIRQLTNNRNKIVFDEKPFILECRKIDIKTLNDIDTALKQGLNDTIYQSDKEYLINTFKTINFKLQTLLQENEQQNVDYKLERLFNPQEFIFDKLELVKFFDAFSMYQSDLIKYDSKTVKAVEALQTLINEGGIVISEKKIKKKSHERYDNYFYVVVNNSDKLTTANANVFVLDGTADISPEYTLNCFNVVNCSGFQRGLSKLNLNIIDLNTSKTKLTTTGIKTDKYIDKIIEYIKSEPEHYDCLFTYQAIEDKFKNYFTTAHFGKIKGTNAFRGKQNITQVGLSVLPHSLYFLLAGAINRYNCHNDLTNIVYDYDTVDNIMCRFILADLEQNIFRGCIRNETNKEMMNYLLFCNYENLSTLTDRTSKLKDIVDGKKLKKMIFDRYSKLGATIIFKKTPIEFKLLKAKERKQDTNTKKILEWCNSKPSGYIFKISELKQDLNIKDKTLDKLREKDSIIKDMFNNMSNNRKGYYEIP